MSLGRDEEEGEEEEEEEDREGKDREGEGEARQAKHCQGRAAGEEAKAKVKLVRAKNLKRKDGRGGDRGKGGRREVSKDLWCMVMVMERVVMVMVMNVILIEMLVVVTNTMRNVDDGDLMCLNVKSLPW